MNNSMKIIFVLVIRIVFNKSRRDAAVTPKWRLWNLLSRLGRRIPDNRG